MLIEPFIIGAGVTLDGTTHSMATEMALFCPVAAVFVTPEIGFVTEYSSYTSGVGLIYRG